MKKLFLLLLIPTLSFGQVKYIPRSDFQFIDAIAKIGAHYYLSAYFSDDGKSYDHSRIYKLDDSLNILDSLSFPTIVRGFRERNDTLYYTLTLINDSNWTDVFYLVDSNLNIIDSVTIPVPNTLTYYYADLEFRGHNAYLLGTKWIGSVPQSFLKIIDLDSFNVDHMDISAPGEFISMGFKNDSTVDLYPYSFSSLKQHTYDLSNQVSLDSMKNTYTTMHTVQVNDSTYYGGGHGDSLWYKSGVLFNKNGEHYRFYNYVDSANIGEAFDRMFHKSFDANKNNAFIGAISQLHSFNPDTNWAGGTIAKTDLQGSIIWFKSIFDDKPFLSMILFSAIKATDDGGCLAAGSYYPEEGKQDIILFKLDVNGNFNHVSQPEFPMRSITVYPNPASERIVLEGFSEKVSYTVYALNGTVVRQGMAEEEVLEVNQLKSGTYRLEVRERDGKAYFTSFVKH